MNSGTKRPARNILASPLRLGKEPEPRLLLAADLLARRWKLLGEESEVKIAVNQGGLWALQSAGKGESAEEVFRREKGAVEASLRSWVDGLGLNISAEPEFSLGSRYGRIATSAFISLFEQGLLTQETVVAPWCSNCFTTLDPDRKRSVSREKMEAYEVLLPLKGSKKHVSVQFAAPELLGAVVGLAVDPQDERFSSLIGRTAQLPFYGRELKVIGTGQHTPPGEVRPLLPAYHQVDFHMAQASHLSVVDVVGGDGRMTAEAGRYAGLTRPEARQRVLSDLEKAGLLGEKSEVELEAVRCEICGAPLSFQLAEAWFVQLDKLEQKFNCAEVLKSLGPLSFRREVGNEADRGKWCVSRRGSQGLPLPVWLCEACGETVVATEAPERCTECFGRSFERLPERLASGFLGSVWPLVAGDWKQAEEDEDEDEGNGDSEFPLDTSFFEEGEGELAYLTICMTRQFEASLLPKRISGVKPAGSSLSPGELPPDVLRLALLMREPETNGRLNAERMLNGLERFFQRAGPLAGGEGAGAGELPLLERWLWNTLRRAEQVMEGSLKVRNLTYFGELISRFALSPVVDIYAPRCSGSPRESLAFVTREFLFRIVPPLSLIAPGTASRLWENTYGCPFPGEWLSHSSQDGNPVDFKLMESVNQVLAVESKLESEPAAACEAVLWVPRKETESIRRVASAFGSEKASAALDRPVRQGSSYKGILFGRFVMLLPSEESNLLEIAEIWRRQWKHKGTGRGVRKRVPEKAELINRLKRLATGKHVKS